MPHVHRCGVRAKGKISKFHSITEHRITESQNHILPIPLVLVYTP